MGLALGRQIYKLQQIRVNEPDSQSHQQQKDMLKHKGRFNLSFQTRQRRKRKGSLQTEEGNKIRYLILCPLSQSKPWVSLSACSRGGDGKEELRLVQISGTGDFLLILKDN